MRSFRDHPRQRIEGLPGEFFAVEVQSIEPHISVTVESSEPLDPAPERWTVVVRMLGNVGLGPLVLERECKSESQAVRRAHAARRQIRRGVLRGPG